METVKVAEARVNGDWCNIKTPEGKEISVMLSKCPKLKAQIEVVQAVPYDLSCKVVEKNGKFYAWDVEEKKEGGKSFGKPRNEKLIVAQSSYDRAVQLALISKMPMDLDEIDKNALHIFTKVCKLGGLNES